MLVTGLLLPGVIWDGKMCWSNINATSIPGGSFKTGWDDMYMHGALRKLKLCGRPEKSVYRVWPISACHIHVPWSCVQHLKHACTNCC